MTKTVSLVGRSNVGKSSIFNRLVKERKAIILDQPGVTRDRIYGKVTYQNKTFDLIDTGGMETDFGALNSEIMSQTQTALDESNLILFVVDGKEPLNASDFRIRDLLIKQKKPVILVVNKIDNEKRAQSLYDFYELGFENIIPVSATHNLGFKPLLELITADISEVIVKNNDAIRFCIIGRPNVGKSSLVNALLNDNRALVSNQAGTTIDASDTQFVYNHQVFVVIDTAGISRPGQRRESVVKFSFARSLKAINRSDVCVLVLDATTGIVEQDKHILETVIEAGKGLVLVVNKWDTISSDNQTLKKSWNNALQSNFRFAPYLEPLFLAAKTHQGISQLMPAIKVAYQNNQRVIKTAALNDVISEAKYLHPTPTSKGKPLKFYFSSQIGIKPPTFELKVNNPKLVHFSYQRYLENKIRANFDFRGTPIRLKFKTKKD